MAEPQGCARIGIEEYSREVVATHWTWNASQSCSEFPVVCSSELNTHDVRLQDLAAMAKLPEARRSARMKHPGSDISREPYMLWTNRRALNSS